MGKKKSSNPDYQKLVVSTLSSRFGYFITGATVFVLLVVATFVVLRSKSVSKLITEKAASTQVQVEKQTITAPTTGEKEYVVKAGDHLWKIAEAEYGSGYNAYDIAITNKITNASLIYAGQKLVIPSVTPKQQTVGEITATAASTTAIKADSAPSTYTVKKGDSLWSIAQATYGNPYKWTMIAAGNNLKNPSIIHTGNVLTIPSLNQARR